IAAQPFTDLQAEFPNARVVSSPFEAGSAKVASNSNTATPLLVLVDNGDGSAEVMARTLKANGNKRYVVLLGGEEMIARKGKPGLQRTSGTMIIRKPPGSGAAPSSK